MFQGFSDWQYADLSPFVINYTNLRSQNFIIPLYAFTCSDTLFLQNITAALRDLSSEQVNEPVRIHRT
jgi:hypothetical protein